MSLYTEDELRDALQSESAKTPVPTAVWPEARRRIARRRFGIRAGCVLATAMLVAVGLDLGLPTSTRRPGPSSLMQPTSYEQACAAEPDVCSPGVTGPIPAALDRRFHLPSSGPGEVCPVTPGENADNPYVMGLQFGSGQVHMIVGNRGNPSDGTIVLGTTSQIPGWFAVENVWLSGPQYQGPFMVRGKRLDGPGTVAFGGSSPAITTFVEPPGPDPNSYGPYRTPPGSFWVKGPGCYGFQIDGLSFSQIVVIDVLRPSN